MSITLTSTNVALGAGTPSRAMTLTLPAEPGSTVTFSLGDGGAGGAFFPSAPTIGTSATTVQFVYTPAAGETYGAEITLTATASGGVSGSAAITLPIGVASTIVHDTFAGASGTLLTNHAPNAGAEWVLAETGNGAQYVDLDGTGRLGQIGHAGHDFNCYECPTAPSSIDYDVAATVVGYDSTTYIQPGVQVAASGLVGYYLTYNAGWYLSTYGGDNDTLFAAVATPALNLSGASNALQVSVRLINGNQYIFCYCNGTLINGAPAQDNSVTGGKPGLLLQVAAGQKQTSSSGQFASAYTASNADWSAPVVQSLPDDALIYRSPCVWRNTGSAIENATGGGYIKGLISGTTTLTLNVDTTINGSVANDMPCFKVQIDDGLPTFVQAAVAATQVIVAAGLSTASHRYRVDCLGGNQAAGGSSSWTGTYAHTRINSLQIDQGGSFALQSSPYQRPNRLLIFGDSITMTYYGAAASGPYYDYIDYTLSYGPMLAYALGAEWSQVGVGSQGYVEPGNGGFPSLQSSWDYFDSTHARVIDQTPNYVVNFEGVNDWQQSGAAIEAAVIATAQAQRLVFPNALLVFVCPFGGANPGTTIPAIVSAIASLNDPRMLCVDPTGELQTAEPGSGATWFAVNDGLHPTTTGHGWIAAVIAKAIMTALVGTIEANVVQVGGQAVAMDGNNLLSVNVVDWKGAAAAAMTGDAYAESAAVYARLGAPAGGSVSADIATVEGHAATAASQTQYLPAIESGLVGGLVLSNAAHGNQEVNLTQVGGTDVTINNAGYLTVDLVYCNGPEGFNSPVATGAIPNAAAGADGGLAIVGSKMDLINAPNATGVATIAAAVWGALTSGLSSGIGQRILNFLGSGNYEAPPTTGAIAAALLSNPNNPLATDSLGRVITIPDFLGTGSITWPITIQLASGDPLGNVSVSVSSDAAGQTIVAGPAATDVNGRVIFSLDPGQFYRWADGAGCTFDNPQIFTVSVP